MTVHVPPPGPAPLAPPPAPRVVIDGPAVLFGGAYGNLQAAEALLAEAARLGAPARRLVHTGDLAAYGGQPAETAALLRAAGVHLLRGNCEERLAAGAADCGCGYAPGSACDALAGAWYPLALAALDAPTRAWMGALPARLDLALEAPGGERRLAVLHGGASRVERFLYASSPAGAVREEMALAGADGVVAGHCGLPFTRLVGGRPWINPGVVGLPANDGTPRAWFVLLTPVPGGLRVEHRALDYDHAAAARALRAAGGPEGYAAAMGTGLWPSCDSLRRAEARAAGAPLTPATLHVPWPDAPPGLSAPARRGATAVLWPDPARAPARPLDPAKFVDPALTAKGERRAAVGLARLEALWLNTGTLCNITCANCYIESSPRNDRLSYLTRAEAMPFLDEALTLGTREIGFTGGEPFLNPEFVAADGTGMLLDALERGFDATVLTNAMRPMQRRKAALAGLRARFGARLTLRVSLDHHTAERHEEERGPGTFAPAMAGLEWLGAEGFSLAVAGRAMWGEDEGRAREGYAALFAARGLTIDAHDPARLVLFPEMDEALDVPEITTDCWRILNKSPADVMCATSRMVVKRKGAERPAVLACTLLPYDARFELGDTLAASAGPVPLNHPHCARFCVLGGASCRAG